MMRLKQGGRSPTPSTPSLNRGRSSLIPIADFTASIAVKQLGEAAWEGFPDSTVAAMQAAAPVMTSRRSMLVNIGPPLPGARASESESGAPQVYDDYGKLGYERHQNKSTLSAI